MLEMSQGNNCRNRVSSFTVAKHPPGKTLIKNKLITKCAAERAGGPPSGIRTRLFCEQLQAYMSAATTTPVNHLGT